MRKTLKYVGAGVALVVALGCGERVVGNLLKDAGTLLLDGGSAHAQTNCTWHVKSGVSVTYDGVDKGLDPGWEPFTVYNGSVFLRRCL